MLIKKGLKLRRFRKVKTLNFHKTFGSTTMSVSDFNLDSGLRPQPDQNESDPIFGTFAQPEGCGGEGIASVMGDLHKTIYNPWFCYNNMCEAEGIGTNSPVNLDFILNEPVTSGVQDKNGNIIRSPQWYEVTPLNKSLFQGIVSALTVGECSVAFASTWYESFDTPIDGVVPFPSGLTSGHFWKFCGVKTINGVQYLIAAPWLGSDWGMNGFCYFSQSIVDGLDGQAFTPNASFDTEPIPVSVETLLESLINFLKRLLSIEGGTQNIWTQIEEDLEEEYDKLFTKPKPLPMPEESALITPVEAPVVPATPSVDTLLPWDTINSLSHANYHNVRVLCDLEGLTLEQKDTLTACVWQESWFMTSPKPNQNKLKDGTVWSTDFGIVQVNDYYNIGEGKPFPSVLYVIDNPEACVRWMAHIYKTTGALQPWSSFTTGAYKAHLGKVL